MDNIEKAIWEYCNTFKPIKEICAEHKICDKRIYDQIKSGQIKKRGKPNDVLMDTLDRDLELKYYLLGQVASDGCLWKNKKNIVVALHYKDHALLERLALRCGVGAKVYLYPKRKLAQLHLRSTPVYDWMLSLGVTPKKSETLNIPMDKIPDSQFKHFLRGYIDGDGNLRKMSEKALRIGIVGNEMTTTSIREHVWKLYGIQSKVYKIKTPAKFQMYKFSIQRFSEATRLIGVLYKDATIFLDRKYEIISQYVPSR